MWHEVLAWIAEQAPEVPSTNSDHDIVIAVIGVGGPFLLGVITLLATTMRRRKDDPMPTPPPIPLNSNDDDDEDELRARNRVLETFLWRNRYDPTKITTGNEASGDVRID